MKTILEARDLCKTYIVDKRQNNVLKNINFSVKEGEMVAIMGPSGSGKSTLLYTVSGMDDATGGDVFFEDKNIAKLDGNELAALRLDEMGFIFQQMYMMKNLTILDNIVLPAMQSKKTKETKKVRLLIANKGTTLKKDYLFNTIWGSDSESEPQTLTVHIKWLREKIEKDPKRPEHIVTVWGVGYRFE
ncbi:MAG: winged helix-turn-helix domain-containing protein [Lachnospiraceae bacterium]|nr:winged helix-turn-helix domain-containing protein [Lachnospiraceae bacterium]